MNPVAPWSLWTNIQWIQTIMSLFIIWQKRVEDKLRKIQLWCSFTQTHSIGKLDDVYSVVGAKKQIGTQVVIGLSWLKLLSRICYLHLSSSKLRCHVPFAAFASGLLKARLPLSICWSLIWTPQSYVATFILSI